MPLAKLFGILNLTGWLITGMRPVKNANRQITARVIWWYWVGCAEYDMGNSQPLSEVIAELRKKYDVCEECGFVGGHYPWCSEVNK